MVVVVSSPESRTARRGWRKRVRPPKGAVGGEEESSGRGLQVWQMVASGAGGAVGVIGCADVD